MYDALSFLRFSGVGTVLLYASMPMTIYPVIALANQGMKCCDATSTRANTLFTKSDYSVRSVGTRKTECIPIKSSVKKDAFLLRISRKLSPKESKGINSMLAQLRKGNNNPGIGTKKFYGITEFRHRNGGRIYARKDGEGWEILAYSGKDKTQQRDVWNRLRELYGK